MSGQHGWAVVVKAQGMRGESRARENEKPTPIVCSLACSGVVALIYLHATARLKGSYTNSCLRGLLDLRVGRNSNPRSKGPCTCAVLAASGALILKALSHLL